MFSKQRIGRDIAVSKVVFSGAAPCLWFRKIRGVALEMQDHVTGQIVDGRAMMGGGIFEDPEDLIIGLLGGLGFLGGDRDEGSKHSRVGGNGVVQKGPYDLLYNDDGLGWQDRRFFRVIGPLDRRAIHGFLPGMEESWGHNGVGCWNLWRTAER